MTFGELLTKIAIVATAWSTWKSGLFVERTAIVFAATLLLLSFFRDSNLRRRGIVRMVPTFGSVCLASVAMFLFLTEGYRWACHLVFMKPEESIMGGCWTALAVQCIAVFCEASTRRTFDYVCGTDEGYFDRIQGRSYNRGQHTGGYQQSYSCCNNNYNNQTVQVYQPPQQSNNLVVVDAPRITSNTNVPLIPRR